MDTESKIDQELRTDPDKDSGSDSGSYRNQIRMYPTDLYFIYWGS